MLQHFHEYSVVSKPTQDTINCNLFSIMVLHKFCTNFYLLRMHVFYVEHNKIFLIYKNAYLIFQEKYPRKMGRRGPKKEGNSRYKGKYCCAVQCHNQQGIPDIKFFSVIRKRDAEQTEQWIKKIKRVNPDGSEWKPSRKTLLCSAHFVSGEASKVSNDVDYVPSLFPTRHVKPKNENDAARSERVGIKFYLFNML